MMPDMGGFESGGRPDVEARSGAVTSVDPSGQPEPIRVLVADDHVLFRRGLEMVLQAEEGIEVVGEAGDGVAELLPDVVLMDVRMPKQTGIEACLAIKESVPSSRIVMLTISDEESDLFEAIRAGANG